MSAFAGLLRKEWLHILRDRRTLFVVIFMPIVQVILFGYAIRTDIWAIRLAIVDPSPDASTLEIRNRFSGSDVFELVRILPSAGPLDRLFAAGDIQEAVVFDADFANRLARGLPARVLVVVDASEPNSGSAMESYAIGVIQGYQRDIALRSGGVQIFPEVRMRFNPTRASSNLFVPGLIAFVLTIISALMTAISLTREKETGTMEILLVSPLKPLEIIVGKVLAYVVIGFVSVLLVVAEARLIFSVPLRGSLLLLLAEGLLYILTSLSLGILISSRTSSQRVAMIGALAGTMLPTILLSGFIFPIESMPWPLRLISNVVPAKWFVLIARGVMLKGVGLEYLWHETLILLGMTLLLVAAATRSFKIRLA
ncbi:MAG TPA: ABC transporter permease [Gemmatimonadaceae bacterium]|jgi:ABC-2 type transport system permease protein